MNMYDWAKNEVEIAKKSSAMKDEDFDYVGECYDSALKAYKSLCDDGHSGLSFGITSSILKRLLRADPLTPIYDEPDVWNEVAALREDECKVYQCRRMSSLFKDVYPDGRVEYSDVNRITCIDVDTTFSYHSSLADRWFNKNYPIKLPYSGEKIDVFMEEFLTDEKNGDFDTVGILYANKDGEVININKYYKADEEDKDWVEITQAQYYKRKLKKINRE